MLLLLTVLMNVKGMLDLRAFMHFLATHISTMFHHLGSDNHLAIVKSYTRSRAIAAPPIFH